MKKFLSIILVFLMTIMVIPTQSIKANTNTEIDVEILDRISEYYFAPNDMVEFNELSDETIIAVIEGFYITKGDITDDYKIDTSKLTVENDLYYNNKTRGVVELYVNLSSGQYSATTKWTVVTNANFSQTTYTQYMTNNMARNYLLNLMNPSARAVALEALTDTILGGAAASACPYAGAMYTLIRTVVEMLDADYQSQVNSLILAGKYVQISESTNNYGRFRSVSEWNGQNVRYRSGSNGSTTTEDTYMTFSTTR